MREGPAKERRRPRRRCWPRDRIREEVAGVGRQGAKGTDRRWLEASEVVPVLTYYVADVPNVGVDSALLKFPDESR